MSIPRLSRILYSPPNPHPHLHRHFLNQHNDRKPIKLDPLPRLVRKIKRPQQPRDNEAQLHPRERAAQTAVKTDAERFAGGEVVGVVFGGADALGEPAFGDEAVGVGEEFAGAVDGEGADAEPSLWFSSQLYWLLSVGMW